MSHPREVTSECLTGAPVGRRTEAGDDAGVEAGHSVFYQVNMREITDALLVPADMLSAKLRAISPPPVCEEAGAQSSPRPSGYGDYAEENTEYNGNGSGSSNAGCGGGGGSVNSNSSGALVDVVSASHLGRHSRHHSTVRAVALPDPDNTYYAEDTLVIGSVGRRGILLDRGSSSTSERHHRLVVPRPSNSSVGADVLSASVPVRSARVPVAGEPRLSSSVSSSRHLNDSTTLLSSSARSVTFLLRKQSSMDSGIDNSQREDTEQLDQPILAEGGASSAKKSTSKTKRVHFPENVIKSVSVVQADDQLRLLVEYNRPWYAHLILVVACAFFVLHWGFIALVTEPSVGTKRFAASAVISFVAFGFASAYLLSFLALTWRPGSEELEHLTDLSRNRLVICVVLSGVFSQLSLAVSFMFSVNVVSLVCFCCIPLVVTYLYEEYKSHSVSLLDSVGCVFVIGSIIIFSVGAVIGSDGDELYARIVPVFIALAGGAAMAFFLFQVRTVSRYVSNFLVISSTVTLTALLLAFLAYATGAFFAPIGNSQRMLTEISSADFLKIILSALFLFLSWFTYHWSSLFFDRMTLSGSFSLGAPIALAVFYVLSLPTASLPFRIAGGVIMTVGCALVLYAGFRFRQNVEVRIELERE